MFDGKMAADGPSQMHGAEWRRFPKPGSIIPRKLYILSLDGDNGIFANFGIWLRPLALQHGRIMSLRRYVGHFCGKKHFFF